MRHFHCQHQKRGYFTTLTTATTYILSGGSTLNMSNGEFSMDSRCFEDFIYEFIKFNSINGAKLARLCKSLCLKTRLPTVTLFEQCKHSPFSTQFTKSRDNFCTVTVSNCLHCHSSKLFRQPRLLFCCRNHESRFL